MITSMQLRYCTLQYCCRAGLIPQGNTPIHVSPSQCVDDEYLPVSGSCPMHPSCISRRDFPRLLTNTTTHLDLLQHCQDLA